MVSQEISSFIKALKKRDYFSYECGFGITYLLVCKMCCRSATSAETSNALQLPKKVTLNEQALVLEEEKAGKEKTDHKSVETIEIMEKNIEQHWEEFPKSKVPQAEKKRQCEIVHTVLPKFPELQFINSSDFPAGSDVFTCSGEVSSNKLQVGSMIQIQLHDEHIPYRYGVIRCIGIMPTIGGKVAGIELVSYFPRF